MAKRYTPVTLITIPQDNFNIGSCGGIDQSKYNGWKELETVFSHFMVSVERIFLIRTEKDFSI